MHHPKAKTGILSLALVLALTCVARAEPVTLNLENAEITALVATVSEVTGKNFVVDPRVKGKVSVISSTAMEKEELYQVFLSILEVHGFAAVPSGKVIKIVPDANAKHTSTPFASPRSPGTGDEIVTRVVQIQNVSATQLVPILRPLVPQQGHLAAYAGTNVLVVSDRAGNIDRLMKIIARIDQESESEVEVIHLRHATASEVVRVLTSLNRPTQGQGAVDASRTLPTLVADDRTNSILMSGDRVARLRIRALVSHLDTPLESTGNTRVVYLRYARAEELASVLTDISKDIQQDEGGQGKQAGDGRAREVGIRADASSNALVITAPPDTFESLRQVIAQLDIRRAQVLVEAILADVGTTGLAELGIQWRERVGGGSGDFSAAVLPGVEAGALPGVDLANPLTGFTYGLVKNGNLRALLRAISADTAANLISTPTLVTLDNEEAEIVVGDNVPFVTGQFTNNATTPDNPFQTIERQDVGVKLRVRPQINEGDAVMLEIEQEVSSVAPDSQGVDITTRKRSIKTNLLVDDGQIVVLGGLIRDDLRTSVQKVPLLGDIPVLGQLFQNKRVDTDKRNLMVFLKPTIVRGASDIANITSRKYNFLRAKQLEQPEAKVLFERAPPAPVLPPFASEPLEREVPAESEPLYEIE